MENAILRQYIDECVEEFKKFMNIDFFPIFKIEEKKYDIEKIEKSGYGALASASYCFSTNEHILEINFDIISDQEKEKPIIFHELTHILDNEQIVKGDKIQALVSLGYEEYHASQIEFMKLIGATNINDKISFKWTDVLNTVHGQITVEDYVALKRNLAIEYINKPKIEWNKNSLDDIIGCIFNYYGRYAICEMYQDDFNEKNFDFNFEPLIDSFYTSDFNTFMHDWFTDNKINNFNYKFSNFIYWLYKKYKICR